MLKAISRTRRVAIAQVEGVVALPIDADRRLVCRDRRAVRRRRQGDGGRKRRGWRACRS